MINVSEGEECRIALVEDGALEELYMERTSSTSHVGNVYKGRVMNVEASIQAAFNGSIYLKERLCLANLTNPLQLRELIQLRRSPHNIRRRLPSS